MFMYATMDTYYMVKLGLYRISGLFYIRYSARYPVSFAEYPAGLITGYPARKTVYNQFWQIKLYLHYILYYFMDRIYYI